MSFLAQTFLAFLVLTHTLSVVPIPWQNRLWHGVEPGKQSLASVVGQPYQLNGSKISLNASEVLAVDLLSGTTLQAKNPDQPRPIASIVKLATAVVILRGHSLDETVTVPKLPSYPTGAVVLNLTPGQKFKVGELLKAALIPSANDAADALAIWDSGSTAQFAAKTNVLLDYWGIKDIHLVDANGLNAGSKASARALEKLGELALLNPTIAATVNTPKATVKDESGKSYAVQTTNHLLVDPRFDGIKTGYTEASGQGLVALAKIKGHKVITVVLNSPDRFGETLALVNFLSKTWSWQ